jgi:hypothetical protein
MRSAFALFCTGEGNRFSQAALQHWGITLPEKRVNPDDLQRSAGGFTVRNL